VTFASPSSVDKVLAAGVHQLDAKVVSDRLRLKFEAYSKRNNNTLSDTFIGVLFAILLTVLKFSFGNFCKVLFVCLLFYGASVLFRLLSPRTVEIKHVKHFKTILKLTRYT